MLKISCEVSISQELRALICDRRNELTAEKINSPQTFSPKFEDNLRNSSNLNWQQYSVRRDGKKPLRFVGLECLSFYKDVDLSGMIFKYSIQLYVERTQNPILAFSLCPQSKIDARSIFCVYDVLTAEPLEAFKKWRASVVKYLECLYARFEVAPELHVKSLALSDALYGVFCLENQKKERNVECHQ